MSLRSSHLELPSASELRKMIEHESPRRAVKQDFLNKHPSIFVGLKKVADRAGIDYAIIDTWREVGFEEVVDRCTCLVSSLENYLSSCQTGGDMETLYTTLSLQIEPQVSNLIFVYGSSLNKRIDRAIELYRQGIAPKIMTTGRGPYWGNDRGQSEGRRQAEHAIAEGVPRKDIIIEEKSINTPDNVKRSIGLWQEMNWIPTSVTIVTSGYHMLRAYMDMYKFTNWDMNIYTASPAPSDSLNQVDWVRTEQGRRIILNEYAKLITGSKIDQMLVAEEDS